MLDHYKLCKVKQEELRVRREVERLIEENARIDARPNMPLLP